jgi:uncharacterized protein
VTRTPAGAAVREALAVVAKAPQVGSVKTRLFGALGPERATALYGCFLKDTMLAVESAAARRPSVVPVLCFEGREDAFDEIGLGVRTRLAQRGEGLGARLRNCFGDLFDAGFRSVVALGADSPTLPPGILLEALDALAREDRVVLGPSSDGGYYLIGTRRFVPSLFEGIAWSTESVLADTIEEAGSAGLEVVLLPEWYDVDTPDELERLRRDLRCGSGSAPFTRALVNEEGAG